MKGPRKRPLFSGGSVMQTDPATRRQFETGKMPRQVKKILSATHKTASRQANRRSLGLRLAGAILGHKVHMREGRLWSNKIGGGPMLATGETWSRVAKGGEVIEGGPARGLYYAYLLAKAAATDNHFSGIMDAGEKGEFIGGGAFYQPSLRLDPNWVESMRRRSRKEAKERIQAVEAGLSLGELAARKNGRDHRLLWKLLTLTMPHGADDTSLEQIKAFNAAFRRLTKTGIWKKIKAGVKGIENKITANGPHVHAHLLILSRYIDKKALRFAWGEAILDRVGQGIPVGSFQTEDGLPIIDVKLVKENPDKKRDDQTSLEASLDEVSKYITKPDDMLKPDKEGRTVSPETLLGLCDIKRWPRMFELLGRARKPKEDKAQADRPRSFWDAVKEQAAAIGEAMTAQRARVHTSCISAAGAAQDPPEWIQERLLGFESESETVKPDPDRVEIRTITEKKRERSATWRELMKTLDWDEWRKAIDHRVKRSAAFRLRWLKTHNPTLFLVNLAGDIVANQCAAYDCL